MSFKISPDQIQQMSSYSILFHYYLHLCAMPLSAYLFEDFAKSIRTIISRVICFIVCFRLLLWGFFCFSFLFFFCFVSLGFFVSLGLLNLFTCCNFIKFYQKQGFLKGFSEASSVPANLVRQNKTVHINPTSKKTQERM